MYLGDELVVSMSCFCKSIAMNHCPPCKVTNSIIGIVHEMVTLIGMLKHKQFIYLKSCKLYIAKLCQQPAEVAFLP